MANVQTSNRIKTETNEKGIAIGIVGPEIIVEKILQTIKQFPSFFPVVKVYKEEEEIYELTRELFGKVEVLFFSGPRIYTLIKENMSLPVPAHYIPLTGTGLYRTLFKIGQKWGLNSLSIDSLSPKIISKTFKELGIPKPRITYFEGSANPTRNEIIQFHKQKFEEGACDIVITQFESVSNNLTKKGIPNEWLMPTSQDIIVSLERALLSTETRRVKESQIVVGMIHIDNFDRSAEMKNTEYEIQRLKLDIHSLLLNYIESLDGYMINLGGNEYSFFTTRGVFESATGGYKSVPLALKVEKSLGLTMSIGIGFGYTANDAGSHARVALRYCKDAGGNISFIVREDKSVIGPLEMTEPYKYDLSLIDLDLMTRVEQSLPTNFIYKFISYVTRSGKTDYTAREMSSILGVTVRSTHRYISSLMDQNLIQIVGEEKEKSRGRPKQIYRLSFISEIIRNIN